MNNNFFSQEIAVASSTKATNEPVARKISLHSRPYLVAEIGINHDGNTKQGLELIERAAESGADAVKFQSYTADDFINKEVATVSQLHEIFARVELSVEQHEQFAFKAHSLGLDFFSTPLTLDWVAVLKKLHVPFLKVASGDVNNFQLLTEIVRAKIPVFHSTGAASFAEIERAAAFYRQMNMADVIFFHCVSLYPTPAEKLNLETIFHLRNRLSALIGFSDHSQGTWAAFAAVSNGAVAVEKHFTASHDLPGPDHKISAEPQEFKKLREKIDLAFVMRGEAKVEALDDETKNDFYGKRSLYNTSSKGLLAMRPRQEGLPKDSDFYLTDK